MSTGPELPTGTVTFLFTDIEGSTRLLKQQGYLNGIPLSKSMPYPCRSGSSLRAVGAY